MVSGFIRYTGVMLALGALGAVPAWAAATKGKSAASSDEVAVMETTKGRMVFEFWDKDAPKTVDNFKKLTRQGFFDGTGFHRIIKGFMVQGGDPKSKNPKAPDLGTGDPGYTIPDEFNAHKHVAGVISMAHSAAANSGGSQFFIMDGAASSLDGKYTAFGHLIEGMNVLKDIASTPVGMNPMMGEKSKPLEWTTVKSVKIVPRSSLAKASGGAEGAKPAPAVAAEVKSVPAAEQAPAKAAAASTPAATKAEEAVPPTAPPAAPADSVHKDGGH